MRKIISLTSGLLFGAGLLISDMVNPARVRAFLDFFGDWDPTLAFVMGGAILVASLAWLIVNRRTVTFTGGKLPSPPSQTVDRKLIGGSAIFGVGWGLVGICPAPAIAILPFGYWQASLFFAAMLAGMALYHVGVKRLIASEATCELT